MDFARWKMTPREEKIVYLLRCERCGHEEWFLVDLPVLDERRSEDGLAYHHRPFGCGGRLVKTAEGYDNNEPRDFAKRAAKGRCDELVEGRPCSRRATHDGDHMPMEDERS